MNNRLGPDARPVLEDLSTRVIVAVAPEEQEIAQAIASDLIAQYQEGFVTAAETDSVERGGFGDIDLVTLVVVPLVVAVLEKLFEGLVEIGLEHLREWLKKHPQEAQQVSRRVAQVVEEEYTLIERQVGSSKARRREKVIKQTTVRVIRQYMDLED